MVLLFVRNNIIVSVLTCYIIRQCAGQTIDACSHEESEVKLCYQLYQPFKYTDLKQSWTQNCQNVECFLQCMVDAIRDCDSTDRYFTYDINVLIVSYRAACDKFELNINALLSCELYNTTCLMVSGALELAQSAAVFYNSSRYVEYKQAQCKYLQLSTDCLQSRGSGECTTELSDYYGELLRVSASLKGCGHPQDHPYFTTYGGPPRCITPYVFDTSETPSTFSAIPETTQLDSRLSSSPVTTNTPPSSDTASSNINCLNVESDLSMCYQLYLPAAVYGDITSVWLQICQNTECFLQCMSDAVGDCDTTDKYFQYDMNVQIVFYRALCNQFDLTVNALTFCHLDNTTCSMISGEMEFFRNASDFYDSGRYLEFRQAHCEYLKRSIDCQHHVSGECTTELAEYAYEITRVLFSLKACGQPQDHPYFTTYGGQPNCITPYTSETSSTPQKTTASLPTTATLLSSTPQTTTTSLPTTSTLLSSTPQTTTTFLPTTSTLLSSTPQTITTSLPTTATLLSSTPQTITTSLPTTATLLSSTPQTTTASLPTTSTLLSSAPQTTTTFLPTTSTLLSSAPQMTTTFLPNTSTLLSSAPQTTTTFQPTTSTLLSSAPQTTFLPTSATLLSSTPQTTATFLPTTSTLLPSAPQTTTIFLPTTSSLLSSAPQTTTTFLPTTSTLLPSAPQTTTTFLPTTSTLLSSAPQTTTTSPTTSTLLSSAPQETTTFLPTTSPLLSSAPQTTTTFQPTTSTLLSSAPQTTTTFIPTTSSLLSSAPQTTTIFIPTTSSLLSSTPQTATTFLPTTSTLLPSAPQTTFLPTPATLLSSTPQTTTTFLPTTTTLLSSTPQTTTTSTSVPSTRKTTASPLGCSESMIAASLSKCFTISLDEISRSSTYDLLTRYCGDLECNIQCYINAVGKCYTEDQFFVYDTEVYKVTSRAFCNDINETMFVVLNCQMTNLSCLTELTNSIQTDVLSAFNAQDYTTYRQTYCSALTSFQSCVAFAASGSCTSTLARHALDFYLASTSYWKCGLQNHEYFTTYGEDVACSAVTTTWGIVILIPFLAMLLDLRVFW